MSEMNPVELKVLIVEDNEDDLLLLLKALRKGGFVPTYRRVQNEAELRKALAEDTWQVVISDYSLPQFNAKEALKIVRPSDIPFFVLSGTIGEDLAVDLMRAGAQDYVMKGNTTRLIPAIYRELDEMNRRKEMQQKLTQQEDQLRQAQKMDAIGRLAGGIAHDFNNYLGAIMMMNEMLLSKFKEGDPNHQTLMQIQNTLERAAALPKQLLTFSRKNKTEFTVLDVNATIKHIQHMLERVVGNTVSVVMELSEGTGRAKLDRSQFEQTLMNLVVNAKDAMPNGGSIKIQTRNVDVKEPITNLHSEVKPGHYVLLSVEDTGTGMNSDTLKRIFEPFFTTKGLKGTGLGLATVFGIVQQSQGCMCVKSEEGKGTTFEIYYPVCGDRAETDRETKPASKPVSGTGRILIVEDQVELRKAIATCLQPLKLEVFEAGSPAEAIELFEKDKSAFDLLITDLVMDGMNGVDLIHHLLKLQPDLKVILMSGYIDDSLIGPELASTIQMIQKPFSISDLSNRVKSTLAHVKHDKAS